MQSDGPVNALVSTLLESFSTERSPTLGAMSSSVSSACKLTRADVAEAVRTLPQPCTKPLTGLYGDCLIADREITARHSFVFSWGFSLVTGLPRARR